MFLLAMTLPDVTPQPINETNAEEVVTKTPTGLHIFNSTGVPIQHIHRSFTDDSFTLKDFLFVQNLV